MSSINWVNIARSSLPVSSKVKSLGVFLWPQSPIWHSYKSAIFMPVLYATCDLSTLQRVQNSFATHCRLKLLPSQFFQCIAFSSLVTCLTTNSLQAVHDYVQRSICLQSTFLPWTTSWKFFNQNPPLCWRTHTFVPRTRITLANYALLWNSLPPEIRKSGLLNIFKSP